MVRRLIVRAVGLAVCAVAVAGGALTLDAQRDGAEWRSHGGTTLALRYSPLDQITRENVKELQIAWRWPSAEIEIQKLGPATRVSRNENTPLMANGTLFTVTGLGLVAALDAGTGQQKWIFDPQSYKPGRPNNGGFLSRNFGYYTDGTIERVLVGTHDGYLISLDAKTGKPDPAFGINGRQDGVGGIRDVQRSTNLSLRGPIIAGTIAIVGSSISDGMRDPKLSPPGDVKAFDVRTGKPLWTFHTVPRAGEVGYDTWLNGSAEYNGNNNVWAPMAYDPELDYLYLPVSTPSSDYYGVDRPGDNLFAESLVCVEAKTGKRVWHFQAVHHGLWDYDFPTNPALGEITVDGRRIKAVIQVSKQGFTYVFDRKTGQPVWPIEERPVPQSTVPGEKSSPTQPFPTKPPAFDLQGTTEENLIDFTPELRKRALEQLQKAGPGGYGPLFQPPTPAGTLALPGTLGGANWGGAAFDPETGILYVPSRMTPSVVRAVVLRLGGAAMAQAREAGTGGAPVNLQNLMYLDGLPLFKPPYARLTAIDLNKGEILWTSAVGNGPRNHPQLKDLKLPPLGDFMDGIGVLLTKNVVFVTTWRRQRGNQQPLQPSWQPYGDPDANRKILYAFDKRTGAVLREFDMDGHAAAPPMSYLHDGKQYIALNVGGNEEAALVALALPDRR